MASASFSYFDTTLGGTGQWIAVADVKVTQKGVVVPASDIDPGKYQYRLKVMDKAGKVIDLSKIIDGDQKKSILVKDLWVFEKEIGSKNLNWKLIETSDA